MNFRSTYIGDSELESRRVNWRKIHQARYGSKRFLLFFVNTLPAVMNHMTLSLRRPNATLCQLYEMCTDGLIEKFKFQVIKFLHVKQHNDEACNL